MRNQETRGSNRKYSYFLSGKKKRSAAPLSRTPDADVAALRLRNRSKQGRLHWRKLPEKARFSESFLFLVAESTMEGALASVASITDQRQRIEQYKNILASVLSSDDIVQAKNFIDHSELSTRRFLAFLRSDILLSLFECFAKSSKRLVLCVKICQCYRMMSRW